VEYVPDQFYRFEANADYFAGMPTVGELVVVKLADTAGALSAFSTNEVDVVFHNVPPEQIDLLGSVEGAEIAQGSQFITQIVVFDVQRPPFDRVAVRKAIALAMDRDDMVETVYLGAATPGSSGWIHPGQTVFNDSVVTEYNPDEAKRLLDEAGIVDTDGDGIREFDGDPMSFELLVASNRALRLRLAELVKQMLLEIGIEVQVSSLESSTVADQVWPEFDVVNGRNYEMAIWGWSAPVLAGPSKVTWLIHSDTAVGFLNVTGFASEEADRLSDALNASADPEERAQLIRDIQVVFADEIPFVVLLYPDGIYAYWANVYDNYAFIAGDGIINKLSFLPESARP
jgi:peptide/nickel transport system substrate-binding protein